jgi:hypothetical protein
MHLRHQVTPEYVSEMFMLLGDADTSDVGELVRNASEWGLTVGNFHSVDGTVADILKIMRRLDLVEGLHLTPLGLDLRRLREEKGNLLPEVLHFLLYTGSSTRDQSDVHWGYRRVCSILWGQGTASIDRQALAAQVMDEATAELGYRPAFSVNSIDAILNWIKALDPPVLQEDPESYFHRRGFCKPELFLLGLGQLYRERGIEYQSNLPLDEKAREYLLTLCLTEPESIQRLTKRCVDQFEICEAGSHGFAGDFVLLTRPVTMEDLMQ